MADQAQQKPSSSVKLVLLGEAAVGKVCTNVTRVEGRGAGGGDGIRVDWANVMQSSLVMRFVNNDFQENKEPTIGGMFLLSIPFSFSFLHRAFTRFSITTFAFALSLLIPSHLSPTSPISSTTQLPLTSFQRRS